MSEITTKLFYGQKVYLALPRCACSENVHDLSYTKLGAGLVRKYIEDEDYYMVEVTNNGSTTTVMDYCPCATIDVACDSDKKDMRKIERRHIFVLDLNDREIMVGDLKVKVGDIINVYPYTDKYKVLAFNSDLTMILACDVNGIAKMGNMDFSQMILVDLVDPTAFISSGDGNPVIPYTYEVLDEEIIEEPEP